MVEVSHLLDTNVLVQILRGKANGILKHIQRKAPGTLAISAVSMGELSFGAALNKRETESVRVRKLMTDFKVIPFDDRIAWEYGILRNQLSLKSSKLIGGMDMMIAATARYHGWILVTHNMREFKRVPNLKCVDWQVQ